LTLGAVVYTVFVIRQSRKESQAVRAEYAQEFGDGQSDTSAGQILKCLGLVAFGIGMVVLGSRWLVNGAVLIAQILGVSELVIGLTIIAVGTSLPEVATSAVASLRGERDIAVGNAIGSNIFNILLVLGVGSLVVPNGIIVPATALRFDMPVMIAVAVACLPIFFAGYTINRWEGVLFLGYFVAYTLYLFLQANHYHALGIFSTVMIVFVVPITFVTIIVLAIRAMLTKQHQV
jgi:cation:H+ antiporter